LNSKKNGKLFAVLMIAVIAYGCGSFMSLVTAGSVDIELPTISSDEQQISTIGDPDFYPVWLKKQGVTNVTNTSTNNSTNQTNKSSNK
jgi:hypothetical protein